jgi:glycosyltransferase involved in cell wall biosynthesis
MAVTNPVQLPPSADVARRSALRSRTVLIVEASSGGIVGGSLTGLVHQVRGMRGEWRPVMALYERKSIERELNQCGVRVFHVSRWRLPKEHSLQRSDAYHQVRRVGALRKGMHFGRQVLRTLAEEFPAALALARIIRAERADVVHLGNGVRANFDGILACWLTRTPVLCHVKGFEKYSSRERWAARHIDAVVCMTEAVRQHCRENGIEGRRTEVVYDALAPEHFRPARDRGEMRTSLGLGPETVAIGIVGGIQEWKGQAVVLEAFARARQNHPELRLLVVGGVHRAGEEYARRLEERVRQLGLESAVIFTGFRSDVPDLMNALDVVVHASVRPEPFGRVILEGMLLGKPVIAAAAGGVPEFVDEGRTGFLVPPGDAEALAGAIHRLAADAGLRSAIGEQARTIALERFSLRRHVDLLSALYDSISKRKQVQ